MDILNLQDKMPCGKYKGCIISDMINAEHWLNSPQNYLAWAIRTWTNYTFSDEIIKAIDKNQKEISDLQREYERSESNRIKLNDERHKHKARNLEHYNDMGAMNDISFQDIYGDFGF